ncbi:nucleotidyl transferase AbiEii/AbiGii toxin family protein [Agrobacterium tumefaciens]|uniref:Nucleotidyl transferase AbiEii/AbiGii toxin family protein n=1 Tax=Agrobacterium tumefaciens TaxID=358 RepID=A0AA44J868_AGRTU|nr:nucleotidyl transferase AbiEii/AbiGii toxin family protein [Agrobacterium tumefaciens]NSL21388.1 nucleotidyl transferase AbiEii/AbiGii toxin family protein [Agrobacterium tumefaciens]NTB88058.1 nucleotidyl transferase AbiEii/AbiGii toxin family protein [Agrobacterium tumefaciens]NTC16840.1 nucleotidyl transferase AbiEii/AbiGii toxin family protein [Agrobacterium tumefaciens]NTC27956.1 nucleotidyl transferase AbiEii/AbiGii toxin family protein [Agrobacterium tumefaciens]NTC58695.1 nucleotidy
MRQGFINVLRSSADERRALFETVASELQTRAENIEKDLYVCWVLDFLFNGRTGDPIGLYFKGGTSLSKAYGLINRFSEDIDIGIYKTDLKVPTESEIAALSSVTKQQKALAEEVDEAARQYISGPLKESLGQEIAAVEAEIGQAGHLSLKFGYDAYRKKDALEVLVVGYKSVFDTSAGYVEPSVRIEGGARPDPLPAEARTILAYVATEMGESDFTVPYVTTVRPERTFWEKVLILHAMTETTEKRSAEVDPERRIPDLNRYSRHYYDVHQIWTHQDYGLATASMRELAEACRQHKELMFRSPDHRYDRAVPGTYRLVPTPDMRKKLAVDYERMSAMIFATPPSFEAMMKSIEELEAAVNTTK